MRILMRPFSSKAVGAVPATSNHPIPVRGSLLRAAYLLIWLVLTPLALAVYSLKLWRNNVNIPFYYDKSDSIWQFTLTKLLLDTGWVLKNPFMGAPGIAEWYNNPAAQTSAAHSVLMWFVGRFVHDAVATQQIYYILNFPMITVTAYIACRLLHVNRFCSVCAGLAFAFLPARFNLIAYAFLSNFFMIPLAVVPAIWILIGRFADQATSTKFTEGAFRNLRGIVLSKPFLISLSIVVAISLTDGYYAFFALLLLGVATGLRVVIGDIRRPLSLVAPLALILGLMATALVLSQPLRVYEHQHREEFAPSGIPDPALQRHPFEAVMYASSLSVILTPSDRDRIPALRRFGQFIVKMNAQARGYPINQFAPLGTVGSLLFLTLVIAVSVTLVGGVAFSKRIGIELPSATRGILGAVSVLSLFVMACSIFGGVGAFIAVVYPTIRGYDRFPLFLSFLLLAGAGVFLTAILERCSRLRQRLICAVLGLATVFALFDQVPQAVVHEGMASAGGFQADQRFVSMIESMLPARAMVYQYPYSNYLRDNHYYGWGSFLDMRFYLHSHQLRWSSGASKNSPVDLWHQRIALLPIDQQLTELEGAGFQGYLVDRTVVPNEEYDAIRRVVTERTGRGPIEDAASHLAFWMLPDPGYRLVYGPDFGDPTRMVISDQDKLKAAALPRLVRRDALMALLATTKPGVPLVIERSAHPDVFRDVKMIDRGMGLIPVTSAPLITGDVSCPAASGSPLSVSHDQLTLIVRNRSSFDWTLNNGAFPLRVGMMELENADGVRLRWDGGFRVPGTIRIAAGESAELHVPLGGLDIHTGVPDAINHVTAVFALVQEGVAWFNTTSGNGVCRVVVTK